MIYLGADHGGFDLKEKIKEWLTENHFKWEDLGSISFDPGDDYPEIAFKVAEKVADEEKRLGERQEVRDKSWKDEPKGILLCRSAAGMVIAANKVKGIRAVSAFDTESSKHAREHNNSNILSLSGDRLSDPDAFTILQVWLVTDFSNHERHVRRLKEIEKYEEAQK